MEMANILLYNPEFQKGELANPRAGGFTGMEKFGIYVECEGEKHLLKYIHFTCDLKDICLASDYGLWPIEPEEQERVINILYECLLKEDRRTTQNKRFTVIPRFANI